MGLKGDMDEVERAWRGAPWRVRIVLALSLLLASTSLASLSDTVFRWKGFALDAVDFYRQFIALPLQGVLTKLLPLDPPPWSADYLVVFGLLWSMLLRLVYFHPKPAHVRRYFVAIALTGYVGGYFLLAFTQPKLRPVTFWSFYVFMLVGGFAHEQGARRIIMVASLLSPPLVVGVAAAVNDGLSRGAP